MTRQKRWRLKKRAENRCPVCGAGLSNQRCNSCYLRKRSYHKTYYSDETKKNKKKFYDQVNKAKRHYGEFWESNILINQINKEANHGA